MKESHGRYINPFLSDKENDKVNLLNNDKVNLTANLEGEKFDKSTGSFEKVKELCIDKNVTECHLVKDICVDEGLSHELSCCPVTVNGDKHDGMINDDIDAPLLPSNRPSDKIKSVESNSLNNSIKTDEPSNNGVTDVDQPISERVGSEAKEPRETNQSVDISNEMKTNENTISNSNNVKLASVISPLEQPLEAQIAPSHHDIASNNMVARGGGESSFSMAGSVLGLITYSGPVASSGSISHRSDGSNSSSVRSFAFPILHNEWNNSPVRMTKVDQVQSPKHKGWRQTLICCRF